MGNLPSNHVDSRDDAGFSDCLREDLPQDVVFLQEFGVKKATLVWARNQAQIFNISASKALIVNGIISERDYYRCAAYKLGLDFVEAPPDTGEPFFSVPDPHHLSDMARMLSVEPVSSQDPAGDLAALFRSRKIYIAPNLQQMNQLQKLIDVYPAIVKRLKMTMHSANRAALEKRCSGGLMAEAVNGLAERMPEFSALKVITVRQAIVSVLVLQVLLAVALFSSSAVLTAVHLLISLFYLGCIGLRLFAAMAFTATTRMPALLSIERHRDCDLPVYSVLVPLYQEANQVNGLVESLLSLDWPPERLEIKLICEADDEATIAAVHAAIGTRTGSLISLVCVPPCLPRTKPKALNYALSLCTGKLLVIYDAEDRPDPLQLREAFDVFQNSSTDLACLQAPLTITNNNEGFLARMFAIEYSGLFDGLLPALAQHDAPLPLGGTSNHFRRSVLDEVGAWDPYNVTEDADLGLRIARSGYRTNTLTRPTEEEAPIELSVWLKQRTRWFKGWFQTWLVHMRHPVSLSRDLGWSGTMVFHLLTAGMIISALAHPFLVYFVASRAVEVGSTGDIDTLMDPLFLLDVITLVLGYLSFVILSWKTLAVRGKKRLRRTLWGIFLYWPLLSIAAWRAAWHLIRRPHEWEKTPHQLRKSESAEIGRFEKSNLSKVL